MNITEFMSFDIAWFTTLPGIFITSGVVILLIALIIFIVTNKKSTKSVVENEPTSDLNNGLNNFNNGGVNVDVTPNTNVMTQEAVAQQPVMAQVPNVEPVMPAVSYTEPVAEVFDAPYKAGNNTFNVQMPEVPSVSPVIMEPTPAVNFNDVQPVQINNNQVNGFNMEEPVQPMPQVQQVVEEVQMPVQQVIEPVVIPSSEPIVQPSFNSTEVQSVYQSQPMPEERHVIYGGADPVSAISNQAESKPVIYGGANPLENTATIPVVSHGAYGFNFGGVQPQQPQVVNPTPVQPVTNTFSTIPEPAVVEPVQPVTAPVQEIPVMQPQTFIPVQPTMAPVEPQRTEPAVAPAPVVEIETLEF